MTDLTPRATVCDVDGCHALIPVTLEDRREHRRGHAQHKADLERLRRAASEATRAVRELTARLADLERDVADIEIPDPVDPFTIVDAEDLEPIDDDLATDEPEFDPDGSAENDRSTPTAGDYFSAQPFTRDDLP